MLIPKTGKKRIFIKTIAFIVAQVFFVTSLGCAEPLYNKNTSSSSTDTKNLRIPMGFGKENFDSEATYRITASMALQTIADGLRQRLDLGEIIEKSFNASFKKQLKAPIEIRLDPSTRVIYISYGNIYMSLNPAGVIADSNEQRFKTAIKQVALIRAEEAIKLADGQQQPAQLSLWDIASNLTKEEEVLHYGFAGDSQSRGRAIEKLRIDLLNAVPEGSLVELKDIMGDPVKFSKWLIDNLTEIKVADKYQLYMALMSYAGFIRAKSSEMVESEKAKYFEMGTDISTYAISLKPKLEDDKEHLVMLATVFIDKLNETAGTDIQRLKQAASAVRSEEALRLELQKGYPWRYDLLRHVLGYIDQIPEDASDIGGDITMIGSPGRFIEYLNEILELSRNKYAHVNVLMERVEGKIQDELEKIEIIEAQQNIPAGEVIKRVKQVNLDAEVPKGEQNKFRWLADNLDRYAGYDAILPVGSMQAMSGDLSPYEPAGWYFDSRYGNDEDLEYLIEKARGKGIDIEIVVDVVLAHTGTDSSGTVLPDRCYLKNPDGTHVKVWGDKLDYTNGETLKYGIWFLRRLKKLGIRWIRCDQMGGLGSSGNLLWSAAEKLGLKTISEWENYQEVPSASIIYYKGIRNELSAWGGVSSFETLKSMLEERLSQLPEHQSMLLILEDHDEQQKGPIINFIGKDKNGNYNLNKLKAYYLTVYMLQLLHYKRVAVMEHSGTGEGCATQVSFMYGAQGCVDFQDEAAKIFPEFAEFSRRVRDLVKEVTTQNSRVLELPSEDPFKRTIEIYLGDKKYEIMVDLTGGNWKADVESIESKGVLGSSAKEYIDMLVNKFQSGEGLIVLEKLTGELVETAGQSLESASQVAESILNRFAPGMEPFLARYLTSILGRITATYPQTTMALINKISEKMSLDEERPDIKNYLEEALDEIAAISPKRAILIQRLKRAYSILDGMKGLNRDKSLLLNIKPYLIEQGGIMLGLSPMGQSLRIIILHELLREGLLKDDELQAAFLHEIMHAERGDEKIWPEIVSMDDKNVAEERVQDIELEVDRLAAECLVLHGRDPKALIRLLEKSDAVYDTLIEGGFLQPSDDPRAIPTPPVDNRIANINIYLTDRDFEEAKKLQREIAVEALQKVIAAYLEIKKSLFNGSPLDRKMTEYIEKQLVAAREIVKGNTVLLSEQALPGVATRTGI